MLNAKRLEQDARTSKGLSIVTTSHGAKISLSIISPIGEFGFLSQYFNKLDSNYSILATKGQLADNIKFYSDFLLQNGRDILEANPERLTEIWGFIKIEHEKWIKTRWR